MKRIVSLLMLITVTAVLAGCEKLQKEEDKALSVAETIEIVEETTGYPSLSRPFRDVPREDIKSVSVVVYHSHSYGGVLNDTQTDEFWEIMQEYQIFQMDNTYGEYLGGSIRFSIEKTDGTELEIMIMNPFLVIDGVGYHGYDKYAEKIEEFIDKCYPDNKYKKT